MGTDTTTLLLAAHMAPTSCCQAQQTLLDEMQTEATQATGNNDASRPL
jgi:hypothetical protein